MEAITRNEISNDSSPRSSWQYIIISILKHPCTFLNTKFNFAGGELCDKTERKKKEFGNVDMIVYLTEGRQFAGK